MSGTPNMNREHIVTQTLKRHCCEMLAYVKSGVHEIVVLYNYRRASTKPFFQVHYLTVRACFFISFVNLLSLLLVMCLFAAILKRTLVVTDVSR